MGAGWRLWRLSWLIDWPFWWQSVDSLAWVVLTLFLCALTIMFVCNISFVELLMFLLGVFGEMCGGSSCDVFMLLFMVLWVPISAMHCRRAVLMLWHAFLFLGLKFFPLFFFLLGGLCYFFCKNFYFLYQLPLPVGSTISLVAKRSAAVNAVRTHATKKIVDE
jgi:hypothetical protein